jgi:hypothetical protein
VSSQLIWRLRMRSGGRHGGFSFGLARCVRSQLSGDNGDSSVEAADLQ